MMSKKEDQSREQVIMISLEDLVPENHLVRALDKAIDYSFIYDLVKDRYSEDTGRPSLDPVILIKLPMIQILFGIKSMRQTIKEIEVNMAYRWFLGLSPFDPVPHFGTFSKNYTRRFKEDNPETPDLFAQIFHHILMECVNRGLVDSTNIFVDATHIKAHANRHKNTKTTIQKQVLYYEEQLQKEINQDRANHNRKPMKDKDDDGGGATGSEEKTVTQSTTDPESGLFHKGEHKEVFAYTAQTACDKHGWILGYTVHPGNEHDSKTFIDLYQILKKFNPKQIIADAGYKTPAIAKLLLDDQINPIFPYKRPMTKDGFFKNYEYVYDELYDCYLCPANQLLLYSTTNKDGYREYKSSGVICRTCPHLSMCTNSKNSVKVVIRHIWQDYLDQCEDLRHTRTLKDLYSLRKETIERCFGTAKENHGLRYTNMVGKARMNMKVGLTFACMNLKKLAMIIMKGGHNSLRKSKEYRNILEFFQDTLKATLSVRKMVALSTV